MGILFWILLVFAVISLLDIIYLIYIMCGSNAPTITEYLCYIFGIIPLPTLFVGILVHLAEVLCFGEFIGHYLL